jgi:predicted nucleic acid-binding protein
LTFREALQLAEEAEILMQGGEYEVPTARILGLVSSSTCSAYDCEFVGLAEELQVPLVTTDNQILSEFPSLAYTPDSVLS